MVRGVDIPWVGRLIYHGERGQNTMGREGVQYILIIMGRGVIKFPNFPKIYIFQKVQNF